MIVLNVIDEISKPKSVVPAYLYKIHRVNFGVCLAISPEQPINAEYPTNINTHVIRIGGLSESTCLSYVSILRIR